jgi:hypothetical protein
VPVPVPISDPGDFQSSLESRFLLEKKCWKLVYMMYEYVKIEFTGNPYIFLQSDMETNIVMNPGCGTTGMIPALQKSCCCSLILVGSVPDPWNFGKDPDPWIRSLKRIQIRGWTVSNLYR